MSAPMFPVPRDAEVSGASRVEWYAGLAMQAMISSKGVPTSESAREEIALWAFRMAQAMEATEKRLHATEKS